MTRKISSARVGWWLAVGMLVSLAALRAVAQTSVPAQLVPARQALATKQFVRAKALFRAYLLANPASGDAQLGLADAELGLHQFESAELEYRAVVRAQPELWIAHKNLVIVEAALGRWDEFDRERALLHAARERGAPGIDRHESDVIDAFDVRGTHWIVRAYDEPAGRSLTRYNFEHFESNGRVGEYISLESAEAAKQALAGGDVVVGAGAPTAAVKDFVLNFYTGAAHGTIARYPEGEPSYERVRRDVLRWLRR